MISVVIPTYNSALLIERTIQSVLRQREAGEFEILIVDDASTDNTLEVVRQFQDPRIRIFRQERNQGPAAARNRGMKEAKGGFLALLDGDDYWEPDFLHLTGSFLSAHPECVAVSVMQKHRIPGKPESISPKWHGQGDRNGFVLEDFYRFWATYRHVCTGSALFRTADALKLGGQREDLRVCEDLEFWALLGTCGKWGFIPQIQFTSDGGAVTKSQGWLEKNMKRWQSAPSVEDWSRRITARLHDTASTQAFALYQSVIAHNLTYSMIQSGRDALARETTLRYGKYWNKKLLDVILKLSSHSLITWIFCCILLRNREQRRKI